MSFFFYWSYDRETKCARNLYVSAISENFFREDCIITDTCATTQSSRIRQKSDRVKSYLNYFFELFHKNKKIEWDSEYWSIIYVLSVSCTDCIFISMFVSYLSTRYSNFNFCLINHMNRLECVIESFLKKIKEKFFLKKKIFLFFYF